MNTKPDGEKPEDGQSGPYGGRQAAALEPYRGQWVALAEPTVVLVAANSPQEVLAWLSQHEQRASGMFRVPDSAAEPLGDGVEALASRTFEMDESVLDGLRSPRR